jgi:hypothetical protein
VVGMPPVQLAAARSTSIDTEQPATAHMRRPLHLADSVIRPCEGARLTTTATLTQRGTLGRVVYRYLTCALNASGIKGTARHATDRPPSHPGSGPHAVARDRFRAAHPDSLDSARSRARITHRRTEAPAPVLSPHGLGVEGVEA